MIAVSTDKLGCNKSFSVQSFQVDTKCKIVPLDMVGRTENGTVYFSADEITVFFQFIGVNHFGFGQKKTLKHNRQSTVGTSAHFKSHNLASFSIQGVH